VATLEAAVAFKEVHGVAQRIRKHLHLDVAWALHIPTSTLNFDDHPDVRQYPLR